MSEENKELSEIALSHLLWGTIAYEKGWFKLENSNYK